MSSIYVFYHWNMYMNISRDSNLLFNFTVIAFQGLNFSGTWWWIYACTLNLICSFLYHTVRMIFYVYVSSHFLSSSFLKFLGNDINLRSNYNLKLPTCVSCMTAAFLHYSSHTQVNISAICAIHSLITWSLRNSTHSDGSNQSHGIYYAEWWAARLSSLK